MKVKVAMVRISETTFYVLKSKLRAFALWRLCDCCVLEMNFKVTHISILEI